MEDSIYWTHAEKEWPWQRIPQDELPEWFSGFAAKAWSRKDERAAKATQEEAEQASTGQPATRSQSKSEGSDKPQPEAEGRSR